MLADGYVLTSPGDRGDVTLSHADFLAVKTQLAEAEAWEQVVGNTRFGGSSSASVSTRSNDSSAFR